MPLNKETKPNLNVQLVTGRPKLTQQNYYVSKVGNLRLPFQLLQHWGIRKGATPFSGLLHFTLDPYLIMLSAKQGGIEYHFLSLWYDSTWDWTAVSQIIGEHSTH